MEAYLDNSATTKCFEEVRDMVAKVMIQDYGNPSSMHKIGMIAEGYIKDSKSIIAGSLKVNEKEIFFTSGGTESNNLAIIGTAMANKRAGMHIITTVIEHPSVHNAMKYLEEQGFAVTYLPVDSKGYLRLDKLEEAIRPDTILVSVMYVSNEIGTVQPIEQIGEIIKKKNPHAVFHVDGIQAFGKYRIRPKQSGIDLLSVSGHKIHGPKGVGFLYVREGIKIKPILYGGNQQKGLRSGTENVPGIAGLGEAVKQIYKDHETRIEYLYENKKEFVSRIEKLEKAIVNGPEVMEGAPHIISVSFAGIKSEVLLHALEEREIYVSAGSACASNKPEVSTTLKAIGVRKELLDATLRFSFSVETRREELEYCLSTLEEILPNLRKYSRY